jgi:D-glycero-alpha-D-manno-heptose 1-phosphate guanylyltransferase
MAQAIILAGGLGTRLRDTLKDIPKPMAPIAGKPFLEYLIVNLVKNQFRKIVLAVGYKREKIKNYFGNGSQWDATITYSEEKEPLGTGGALKKALELVDETPVLVLNGDSIMKIDMNKLISHHILKKAAVTIGTVYVKNAGRYGKVESNKMGEVTAFSEKGDRGPGFINGGVYVVNTSIGETIPKGKVSLEKEILPLFLGKGLFVLQGNDPFIDIGLPEDLHLLSKDIYPFIEKLNC